MVWHFGHFWWTQVHTLWTLHCIYLDLRFPSIARSFAGKKHFGTPSPSTKVTKLSSVCFFFVFFVTLLFSLFFSSFFFCLFVLSWSGCMEFGGPGCLAELHAFLCLYLFWYPFEFINNPRYYCKQSHWTTLVGGCQWSRNIHQ